MLMQRITEAISSPKTKRAIELAIGPLLLFALWWIAFKGQLVNKDLLPSPVDTLRDTAASIAAGKMTGDFVHTIARVGYSTLIAVAAGVPIGIVLGAKAAIYRSVEFLIDFFRSTPATAMFPLFLLLFGLGDFAKIAVAAFAAWLVIVFNVAYGVMNARQTRILRSAVDGRLVAPHLQRRHLLRNLAPDFHRPANRRVACAGGDHRRRDVHRRD